MFNLKRKLVEAAHPGTVITIYPPRCGRPQSKEESA
jgi:hypothetical protein